MSGIEKGEAGGGTSGDALAELIRVVGRPPPPPEEHYRSVREAARAAWQAKLRARQRRSYRLAASLALAIGIVALAVRLYEAEPAPVATLARTVDAVAVYSDSAGAWRALEGSGATVHAGDRLRAGGAGGAAFSLGSGGELRISARSELRLAGPRAFELVRGTLYVDSRAGRTAPIEVLTMLGRVRDIGTQFEVHTGGDVVRVRVRSGHVEFVDSPLGTDVEATAGVELELASGGALERRAIVPDSPIWDWAVALAVPQSDTETVLGHLEWIARETGKSLRFESPNVELRAQLVRWRGDVRGLTPWQLLEAIVVTSDFVYQLTADGAILIGQKQSAESREPSGAVVSEADLATELHDGEPIRVRGGSGLRAHAAVRSGGGVRGSLARAGDRRS